MWWRSIPNAITLLRFPLGALFVILHARGYVFSGLGVGIVMCLSDGLDGYLARRWRCVSEFGTRIEPFADRWAYGSVLAVVLISYDVHMLLYPAASVLMLYECLIVVAWAILRQRDIRTNIYAKRRTACVMIAVLALYLGGIAGAMNGVQPIAIMFAYAAAYYATRSVVQYARDRGHDAYVPRPFHLL